jgi:hypothetical protein
VRLALALAALAAGAAPWAALPGFPTTFTVRVIDEAGRPVPDAFVVAREFVTIPQFHGSRSACERADAGRAGAGSYEVRLPAAGAGHLSPNRSHALEALAYAKGLCVERTPSARAAAYTMSLPAAMRGEGQKAVEAGAAVALRARPMGMGEERLEYLVNFSSVLVCSEWSARSRDGLARLVQAIDAEADAIPRESAYAKSLAQRLRGQLAIAGRADPSAAQAMPGVAPLNRTSPARNFLVAPANAALRWPAATETGGMVVMAVNRSSSGDASLAVHCRPGFACNLDERDENGKTALYQFAAELDVERVTLLLERGADPSVAVDRFGADAIDAVIGRAIMRPPALGSIDAGKALAVIELLAASPKAAIRASLAEQLKADPAQWMVKSPESLAILTKARERLAAVPARPDSAATCERVEAEAGYEMRPPRLR